MKILSHGFRPFKGSRESFLEIQDTMSYLTSKKSGENIPGLLGCLHISKYGDHLWVNRRDYSMKDQLSLTSLVVEITIGGGGTGNCAINEASQIITNQKGIHLHPPRFDPDSLVYSTQ